MPYHPGKAPGVQREARVERKSNYDCNRLTGSNRRRKYIPKGFTEALNSRLRSLHFILHGVILQIRSHTTCFRIPWRAHWYSDSLGPILGLLNRNLYFYPGEAGTQTHAFFTGFKNGSNVPKKFAAGEKEHGKFLSRVWHGQNRASEVETTGLPGGRVDGNPPASAGDTVSSLVW